MNRVLVVGGYGTFGAHVSRELAARQVPLTIAGRDRAAAECFAKTLGTEARSIELNIADPTACRLALSGHGVVVNCAGPFARLDATLLEACLEAGCHHADITDDRQYAALVRRHSMRFAERNLTAVYGCSSLPGISGALALLLRQEVTAEVRRVRVTLFIGNRNPKGKAAVGSLVAGLGRALRAPQGLLYGFRDREVVTLPAPFGKRAAFNFDSPEYDLFPTLLNTGNVSVKVCFELRAANYLFAALAMLGSNYSQRTAAALAVPGRWLGQFGCSGGAVMTELFLQDNSIRRATLLAREHGQRMAALPCAIVAHALTTMPAIPAGAFTAYEFLGARTLLELVAAGFELID